MRVSIVIPVYNALDRARECVESIYKWESGLTFEVIVADNGSGPEVQAWLLTEEKLHANLRRLHSSEALGFARAVNWGAAAATGKILIVLNSDTIVTPGWMEGLNDALESDPLLGAVTPYTNWAGDPAQIDLRVSEMPAWKALAEVKNRPKSPDILYLPQRLTFFCVALRLPVWKEMRGLDESYGVGNFEDDDLCLRLRAAAYRLGVAKHVFVYHYKNSTFEANGIDHGYWLTRNAGVFAARARGIAEERGNREPSRPKRSAPEISVIIQPRPGASLDRTLRGLRNQTVCDFETILPGTANRPAGQWIAWIAQGDIFYAFHLEALLNALERSGGSAIFSDGWIAGSTAGRAHPDAAWVGERAPLQLAGWMHHASLDPGRLWEQSQPEHWPRLTWEMHLAPPTQRVTTVETARRIYRNAIPLKTRLAVDRSIRRLLGMKPSIRPGEKPVKTDHRRHYLDELAHGLTVLIDDKSYEGRFAARDTLPPVFFFNIVSWNTVTQRPHHLARGLAERGHRVFWLDMELHPGCHWWTGWPLRQPVPGVHLLRLPGPARDMYHMPWSEPVLDLMVSALTLVASAYGLRQSISLVNFPRWQPLAMRLKQRLGWPVIYDCLDDQRAFADLYGTQLSGYEDLLIDEADLLITSSAILERRIQPRRRAIRLHNAVDYDLFSSSAPAGNLDVPRPIVGFFGALAAWLDTELIAAAADRFPAWTFVFIGPNDFPDPSDELRWRQSTTRRNIIVLPRMEPLRLAAHLADFDVCIVPFRDVPVTRTMNPVKIYEYLAAGKPVVSRDLPEVRCLTASEPNPADLVALYSTPEEFFDRLRHAVAANTPELASRRRSFARRNDWSQRVEALSRLIVQAGCDASSSSASSKDSNTQSHE